MSLEEPQSPVADPSHGQAESNPIPSESNCQLSTHNTHSTTGSMILDHVNEAAIAAAYQEEPGSSSTPTTPGPLEKANFQNSPGEAPPAVEESLEARLGRLGGLRPDVFGSSWGEIGFVFSISMSQVLLDCFVSGFAVILPILRT